MHFKGKHRDKRKITYKAGGDGFQADEFLKHEHHQYAMDNLYNSASFYRAAYNHEKKVLCHGVTRKGGRGIPDCVQQEDQKSAADQRLACGTVKVAVLEGDTG
eukprot:11357731-Ditylum_brightwellii.AAC.1